MAERKAVKALVKKPIIDKYTGTWYGPGTVLEITRKRFDEIRSVDPELVEEIKPKRTRAKKAE